MIIEMIKYKSSLSLVLMFAVMPVLLMSFILHVLESAQAHVE